MSVKEKLLLQVLCGTKDKNITFDDLCCLLKELDFSVRIKGGHHIFYMDGIKEIINLQAAGKLSKPYQVKQVRNIILKYQMGGFPNV